MVRTRRLIAAVAVFGVVSAGSLTATASAHHIAGATYTGSHSGGGTVTFDVSPDGTKITRFRANGVVGDVCQGSSEHAWNPGFGDPLVNHAFSSLPVDELTFSGTFPNKQAAQGTFSVDVTDPAFGHCRTPTFSWNATTSAPVTGSEECRTAQAGLASAQGQVDAAQAAANAAASAADRARAAIKAAKNRIKKARTKQRRAQTSAAKKKAKKLVTLANKALAKAKTALATAVAQGQNASTQQQDTATSLQIATAQHQAECS
jgi:hypothetical protein